MPSGYLTLVIGVFCFTNPLGIGMNLGLTPGYKRSQYKRPSENQIFRRPLVFSIFSLQTCGSVCMRYAQKSRGASNTGLTIPVRMAKSPKPSSSKRFQDQSATQPSTISRISGSVMFSLNRRGMRVPSRLPPA